MQRSTHLDLARGIAALLVLINHVRSFVFVEYARLENPGIFAKIFYFLGGLGHQSVMIFFVLSGFLITKGIQDTVRQGRWSWQTYAVNRLSRLWVVLLPCLALTCFWDKLGQYYAHTGYYDGALYKLYASGPLAQRSIALDLWTFLGNLCFFQTVWVPVYGTNGPLWSLANEFWYYVLFPLGYVLIRTQQPPATRVLLAAVGLLLLWALPSLLLFLGGVWLFGYGVVVLLETEALKNVGTSPRYLVCTVLLLIGTLALSGAGYLAEFIGDVCVGAAFALLLIALVRQKSHNRTLASISTFFSNISYTLYLCHFPFVGFLVTVLLGNQQAPVSLHSSLIFCGVCVAALAYAYVLYLLFEKRTDTVRRAMSYYLWSGRSNQGSEQGWKSADARSRQR